jgi:3'-phosphoadenosine 5'-phosphosulfate sulfotransferase (PAPS reductase)/FAD synthetase
VTGTHVALVSGGLDSTVAAHVAVRWGPADLLVYLDTTTAPVANRQYLNRLADHLGVQLWTLRTHKPYDAWVRDWGQFPGDGLHTVAYRRLKEAQIDKLYSVAETPLHLYTWIRARESDARMASAAPVEDDNRRADRYWHNPILSWSKAECRRYLDRFNLPRNHLWRTLGRSADCFCGAYGAPEELLDLAAAGCERAADELRELERDLDRDDERGRWAWAGLSDVEARAERVDELQATLCSSCARRPATDGGGDGPGGDGR